MSILSDLMGGKITFSQAETEVEAWADKLISNDPTLTNATAVVVSDVKQAASDAITIGASALSPVITVAAKTVETALELALSGATKGLSVGFNPLISAGIDTIAGAMVAEITAWSLQAKAELAGNVANAAA